MGIADDRIALEARVGELRELLDRHGDEMLPDTKITVLGTVVQAQALMLVTDTLLASARMIVHDGLRPLMTQLDNH